MGYSRDDAWEKSNGYCRLCGKLLVQGNGIAGQRGAWHVDHSNPQSRGGTNSPRNLNAICARCNIKKSDNDRSLAKARGRTQAKSTGGRMIDGINRVTDEFGVKENIPDGFAGASRKRFWKK